MHAAELADPQVLALLLAQGAAVNADRQYQQRTALFYAARADRAAAIAALAKAGAKLAAVDSRDYSALDAALTVDADQAAAQLRTLGAKPLVAHANRQSGAGKFDAARPGDIYRGWPVVALAVARGDAESVQRLLAGGADPDSRSAQGDTLLHIAMHAGSEASIKPLLAAHANPRLVDKRGRTALVLAATRGEIAVVKALLAGGVDADTHADKESTAAAGGGASRPHRSGSEPAGRGREGRRRRRAR